MSLFPLTSVKGISGVTVEKLQKLEVFDVVDLLQKFPREYQDLSKTIFIQELILNEVNNFQAKIMSKKNIFLRGRGNRTIQTVSVEDETGKIDLIWFNMPFIIKSLEIDDVYYFAGKVKPDKSGRKLQVIAPLYEKISENQLHTARIVPIYRLTKGISPKIYRRNVFNALSSKVYDQIPEHRHIELPKNLDKIIFQSNIVEDFKKVNREIILDFMQAINQIHFPENTDAVISASNRLAISELFPIIHELEKKDKIRKESKNLTYQTYRDFNELYNDYWKYFEFEPTSDQKEICLQIYNDFNNTKHTAYRLIQGDVGSGKTAVAGFGLYLNILSGYDSILLVPTTILAEQHYNLFKSIWSEHVGIYSSASKILPLNSYSKIIIGTQAILHNWKKLDLQLGCLIIDEEHKFGVKQREELAQFEKTDLKIIPHIFSLTATPIPRSLALSIYGNIDISRIDILPKHQKKRTTYVIPEPKRIDSYKWLNEAINKGEKVFWVCPLIEEKKIVENEATLLIPSERATVIEKQKELISQFKGVKIEILHGKMSNLAKSNVLEKFKNSELQILVTTTVVEVGIDIPDANYMVIENADNFGLAQLHQLRGRVGRGGGESYCLVFGDSQRLKTFSNETNGLKLAEFDLETRGPGEVYGNIQSGIPILKIAKLNDRFLIESTKKVYEQYKKTSL